MDPLIGSFVFLGSASVFLADIATVDFMDTKGNLLDGCGGVSLGAIFCWGRFFVTLGKAGSAVGFKPLSGEGEAFLAGIGFSIPVGAGLSLPSILGKDFDVITRGTQVVSDVSGSASLTEEGPGAIDNGISLGAMSGFGPVVIGKSPLNPCSDGIPPGAPVVISMVVA